MPVTNTGIWTVFLSGIFSGTEDTGKSIAAEISETGCSLCGSNLYLYSGIWSKIKGFSGNGIWKYILLWTGRSVERTDGPLFPDDCSIFHFMGNHVFHSKRKDEIVSNWTEYDAGIYAAPDFTGYSDVCRNLWLSGRLGLDSIFYPAGIKCRNRIFVK